MRFPRATHLVIGLQYRDDARTLLEHLREQMGKAKLSLHPEKTRLVRFGRFAIADARRYGERKAGTFSFLGFTHSCGKTQRGKFLIVRHTEPKRMRATLLAIKVALMRCRHRPIPEQGAWLRQVLNGYFAYYAVPTNTHAMRTMRSILTRHWRHALNRRSQRARVPWSRMVILKERWLPRAQVLHPWPFDRFVDTTRDRSPVR